MFWAILFWTVGVVELIWSVYLLGCSVSVRAIDRVVYRWNDNHMERQNSELD